MKRLGFVFVSLLLLGALEPLAALAAQVGAEALGRQSLRPYWHVFIAYAVVWLVVMGWMGSIARRLSALERQISE